MTPLYMTPPPAMSCLQDLYQLLCEQPEPEAKRIATALELYCTGSGYAESIRYGVVKEQTDIERYTDIILKKTKDLTHSIEDILTHVQPQMHEMSVKKEKLYARPFFEKLLADIAEDVAAKSLSLESSDEIPNILITADPARITQVFQNIIGNAVKYTALGSCITVSAEAGQDEMRFSIEDTGCGIRPEDVPFVFEPFFRGEKSRDPNVSGSGLGLSIALLFSGLIS